MSDFKGILIEDSRLQLTDEVKFGVVTGPAQSTFQPYNAISVSNSNVNFNINCPSESIVIDRHLLIQSQTTLTLTATNVPVNQPAINWGWNCGWGSFPIQSTFTSCSTTINNCTVTSQTQDIYAMILRLNDDRVLASTNSTTAAMADDAYGIYDNGVGSNNNPLASFNTSGFDSDFTGRGSIETVITVMQKNAAGDVVNNSIVSTALTNVFTIVISSKLTEPFLTLSPFLAMQPDYDPGLMGINNITFNIQLDSTLKRIIRTGQNTITPAGVNAAGMFPTYITSISPGNPALYNNAGVSILSAQANMFTDCRLLFNFLSLQPDQASRLKSARNIVSYLEYPRFLSSATNNNALAAGATTTYQSQSLQLNMVNDLILIGVRIPMAEQQICNTDSWLTVKKLTISYNNQSGILASASPEQLFNISKKNGSGQNWNEFNGLATNGSVAGNGDGYDLIPTTGSLLVLCPALDFNLDPSLASSSLGQFQFLAQIECFNQYPFAVRPEVIILTVNSGVFSTMNGTSEIQKGILTREMVLKVKQESPASALTTKELNRLTGGKLSHRGVYNTHPIMHHHRHHRSGHGEHHRHHRSLSDERKMGGVSSGGAHSGGKLKKHLKM